MPKLYRSVANATVDASGNASFSFEQIPMSSVWMGSITIPGTISSSALPVQWNATDLGIAGTALGYPVASWWNAQASGTIQAVSKLNVTGSGLAPGTLQAFFQGYVYNSQETPPPWWPEPTPAPPPGMPVTLVSLTGFAPGSGSSLLPSFPSQAAPVILGTSLEVLLFEGNNGSGKLTIYWSLAPAGINTNFYTFEVPNDAITTPQGSSAGILSGLVLPNLGPYVHIVGANANVSTGTIDAIINTGLPPITRPPMVTGGILAFAQAPGVAGGAAQTYSLPPYDGDVCLSATLSGGTINQLDAQITAFDYLGVTNRSVLISSTELVAGAVPTIPPTWFSLPPKVCQITLTNRDTVAHDITFQLVAAGP